MKSQDALLEFQSFLGRYALDLSHLTPERGLNAMLGFYRDVRALDCQVAQDGDMLLYQWGTYDWGKGARFELDFTRQFIFGAGEDDAIWQLSLTFAFHPSETLRGLGQGNRWCKTPAELPEYESFVKGSLAFTTVSGRADAVVELDYECAG